MYIYVRIVVRKCTTTNFIILYHASVFGNSNLDENSVYRTSTQSLEPRVGSSALLDLINNYKSISPFSPEVLTSKSNSQKETI